MYEKFSRVPAESVEAGDICAVCGVDNIQVRVSFCMELIFQNLIYFLVTNNI